MSDQEKDYSEAISRISDMPPEKSAVICCNDIVLERLLKQMQKHSPALAHSTAFAGFDGSCTISEEISYLTMRQNPGMIGLCAAQQILQKIQSPSFYGSSKTIPVELVDCLKD